MIKNIFAIYKPVGITSHDVVNIVRKKTGVKRVGHGGTLDPLAQGVLVIAVGRENTKKLYEYVKGEKEYVAEIKLGFESTTDDEEGEKIEINIKLKPTLEEVEQTLKKFVGKIKQVPPIYSAIKIMGKPAYKLARALQGRTLPGPDPATEKIKLEPRIVEIKEIKLLLYKYPVIQLKVTTGPGVYIRSLARDLGEKLATGGYLKSLIRTKVGEFTLENSLDIKKFS